MGVEINIIASDRSTEKRDQVNPYNRSLCCAFAVRITVHHVYAQDNNQHPD